ncbi:MAG: nitroreductase family protein [Fervidicoccaceae archaeon]
MEESSKIIEKIIGTRRSIRWFKQDPIPDEDLRRILEAGIRAPTASGAEQWLFVVVKDEGKRRALHDFIKRGQMIYLTRMLKRRAKQEELKEWESMFERGIYLAPIYVMGLLNYNRRRLTDEYHLYEYLWGIESVTLALGNMILTAWAMGYGSVWIAVPQLLEEELKATLGLPENASYVGTLAIGKPAEQPELRPRIPLEESVVLL